ncbi:uncharacterized protein AB675_10565 [Cyphellophora attinorum]|uniref:Uncharacterized protein n=1 Tax=Cyphellophora attinorum TaxID=1664694 RepID=A0A0N1P0M3_9EURO|nr:uncharacterized protein AB675_10565 [Phialophora attinorum]KPI40623.1 hypothetical protein AB675_10565 [Phialophora attinorum]
MNTARIMRLQPLRQAFKPNSAAIRQPLTKRSFHQSRSMFRAKEEDHSAHTITQRLKSLKKIPPELLPLGDVISFALFAAAFAMGRKLIYDKTLRLSPQRNSGGAH